MKNTQIQSDLTEFNNLHPNRKLAVFGIILFVFVLSVVVGIYYSRRNAQTGDAGGPQPTSATNAVATTSLTIVPSAETVKVGETMTVSVMIDGEAVQATDVVVTFDPKVFTASNIQNGTVYESIIRQDITEGNVSITAAVSPTDTDNLKTGEIFSFTLEAIAAGSSELSFDPKLTITAKNGINTLQGTQNVTVTAQ